METFTFYTFPHGTFSLLLLICIFIICRYRLPFDVIIIVLLFNQLDFIQTKLFLFNLTLYLLNFRSQLLIFSFLFYFPLFTKMFQFNKLFFSIIIHQNYYLFFTFVIGYSI